MRSYNYKKTQPRGQVTVAILTAHMAGDAVERGRERERERRENNPQRHHTKAILLSAKRGNGSLIPPRVETTLAKNNKGIKRELEGTKWTQAKGEGHSLSAWMDCKGRQLRIRVVRAAWWFWVDEWVGPGRPGTIRPSRANWPPLGRGM